MLARIAQELFWLGRDLTRAEHTARMLDGAFHADVAGDPGERGIALSWEGVLATIGAKPPAPGEEDAVVSEQRLPMSGGIEVARLLTLDTDSPASVVSCVARARERGRTLRDVISTEMWEALNSFYLLLGRYDLQAALRTGPYSVYQEVKERCALFWGLVDRTMLRDEGRAFLEAGGRIEEADMVLRMLRVAIPPGGLDDGHETEGAGAAAGGRRLPGLPARRAPRADGRAGDPLPALRLGLPRLGRVLGRGADRRAFGRRRAAAIVAAGAAARAADRRPRAPAARPGGGRRACSDARTGTGRAGARRSRHRRPLFCDRRAGRRAPLE